MKTATEIVNEQAKDESLWFVPETITETILQNALRRLHESVEGRSKERAALDALGIKTQ